MWVWSLGQEDPLEYEMATHSSILVWKIPWIEESGGLQSMGSQRVGHDWARMHDIPCHTHIYMYMYIRKVEWLSRVWLFATLWTVAHETPLSMGFSRQKYWSRLPYPLPGDLPDLGIELTSFMSPALAGRFFLASATWEALRRKHRRQTLCNTGLRKRRHTDG